MEGGRETRPLSALERPRRQAPGFAGDPGSGKSTLPATWRSAWQAPGWNGQVNLRISGRAVAVQASAGLAHGELAPSRSPCAISAPARVVTEPLRGCGGSWKKAWPRRPWRLCASPAAVAVGRGALVLLDGLDEVADPAKRGAVRDAVEDFANTYNAPANRYLVTCRVYAYQARTAVAGWTPLRLTVWRLSHRTRSTRSLPAGTEKSAVSGGRARRKRRT